MRRNIWTNTSQPETIQELQELIAYARDRKQTVVPRGGGHSYDAAHNSNGMTIDLSLFRHVLAWDTGQGRITVEPGVTVDKLWRTIVGSEWRLGVLPSAREATIGACLALNACGANAWHAGSIGEYVSAFDLLLPTGEVVKVTLQNNDELFYSAIGGLGMLGIITSITLQLQRIRPAKLFRLRRVANSLSQMFDIFTDEAPREGYLMGWIDRYPREGRIGSGVVICGRSIEETDPPRAKYISIEQFQFPLSPVHYFLRNILSRRCYFFHPFVPARQAQAVFSRVLQLSQQSGFVPLWGIMRQHRSDSFVLSSQVDGFSLELAYPVNWRDEDEVRLVQLLKTMLNQVIEADGKLYLAHDRILDAQTFKRMMGRKTIDRFQQIKASYDPNSLFQSNLFRRLF